MTGVSPDLDSSTRVAEIRQENHGGDVSFRDIEWLCDRVRVLEAVFEAFRRLHGIDTSDCSQSLPTCSDSVACSDGEGGGA